MYHKVHCMEVSTKKNLLWKNAITNFEVSKLFWSQTNYTFYLSKLDKQSQNVDL